MVAGLGDGRLGHHPWLGQLRDNHFLHASTGHDYVPDAHFHLDDFRHKCAGPACVPSFGRCTRTRVH